MLSLDYRIGEEHRALPWDELTTMGERIASGKPPDFSSDRIEEAARYVEAAEKISGWLVVRDVVWWLLPVLLFGALLLYLLMRD